MAKRTLWELPRMYSKEDNEKVLQTGNLHPSSFTPSDHHCHMFTASELKNDVQEAGFKLLELSASNSIATARVDDLQEIMEEPEKWNYLIELEIRACKSSGMVESGTHLIAVLENPE